MGLSSTDWQKWKGNSMPLGLGTAQLGFSYGIANAAGLPSDDEARRVLAMAWEGGVRFFDTAQAYGVSEERLGNFIRLHPNNRQALIVSKLAKPVDLVVSGADLIRQSTDRIGIPLWGMLLHHEDELEHWQAKWEEIFLAARSEGLLSYAGVSVYTPDTALTAINQPGLDIIQLPGNVFDRRTLRSGVFREAVAASKAVFVRSIFLQGLIGCTEENLPAGAGFAHEAVRTLNRFCAEREVEPNAFAVAYAARRWQPAVLVLGAEQPYQVMANIAYLRDASSIPDAWLDEWDDFWPEDRLPLIDPRQWPKA